MRYDLYGSRSRSIDDLVADLEHRLGVRFTARNGDYRGGDYFNVHTVGREVLTLQPNRVIVDGDVDFAEPDFPEYPVLLRIDDTERGRELEAHLRKVGGLELLKTDGPLREPRLGRASRREK